HVRFFFQAEDGIRDRNVTGVQTCALPICPAGERAINSASTVITRGGIRSTPNEPPTTAPSIVSRSSGVESSPSTCIGHTPANSADAGMLGSYHGQSSSNSGSTQSASRPNQAANPGHESSVITSAEIFLTPCSMYRTTRRELAISVYPSCL